jgi:hypothetical protein
MSIQWNGTGWASDVLVDWYDEDRFLGWDCDPLDFYYEYEDFDFAGDQYLVIPANPANVDRDGDGAITWQEAKFWQLESGDVYTTGYSPPGDRNIPLGWSYDPYDQINSLAFARQRGYPRTWMPIIRCFYHQTAAEIDYENVEEVLNLAIDGNTFYSVPGWEQTAWKYGKQMGVEDW